VKHKQQGLVVLGVNRADDRQIALEYLKANGVTFPNALDTSLAGHKVMRQYETLEGMSSAPLTYVISREGKVVDAWYGYLEDRTRKAIQKLGL
jgi:peroxiredoxin